MRLNKTEHAPVEFVDEDIGHARTEPLFDLISGCDRMRTGLPRSVFLALRFLPKVGRPVQQDRRLDWRHLFLLRTVRRGRVIAMMQVDYQGDFKCLK